MAGRTSTETQKREPWSGLDDTLQLLRNNEALVRGGKQVKTKINQRVRHIHHGAGTVKGYRGRDTASSMPGGKTTRWVEVLWDGTHSIKDALENSLVPESITLPPCTCVQHKRIYGG